MLLHKLTVLILGTLLSTARGSDDSFSDDSDWESDKCQNETRTFLANATGVSEAYPSNLTCTFLNETFCELDLSTGNSTLEYKRRCFEADGLITLFTSTAECSWTSKNGTSLYASIVNDPVCVPRNCSFSFAPYNVLDLFENLLNNTALYAECFQFQSRPTLLTSLTESCAADTLWLQAALPEVTVPFETCKSNACIRNYSDSADVYHSMCRGLGGNAFRLSERIATCQDNVGAEVVVMETNVPFCFGARCTREAVDEEGSLINQHWIDQIGQDYSQCTFSYSSWELAVDSQISSNDNKTSGGMRSVDLMRMVSTLLLLMFAVSVSGVM